MRKDWVKHLPYPEMAEYQFGDAEVQTIKEIISLHNRYNLCLQGDFSLDVIDYYSYDLMDMLERILPLLAHLIGIPPMYFYANGYYAKYYYDDDAIKDFEDDIESVRSLGLDGMDIWEYLHRKG